MLAKGFFTTLMALAVTGLTIAPAAASPDDRLKGSKSALVVFDDNQDGEKCTLDARDLQIRSEIKIITGTALKKRNKQPDLIIRIGLETYDLVDKGASGGCYYNLSLSIDYPVMVGLLYNDKTIQLNPKLYDEHYQNVAPYKRFKLTVTSRLNDLVTRFVDSWQEDNK